MSEAACLFVETVFNTYETTKRTQKHPQTSGMQTENRAGLKLSAPLHLLAPELDSAVRKNMKDSLLSVTCSPAEGRSRSRNIEYFKMTVP